MHALGRQSNVEGMGVAHACSNQAARTLKARAPETTPDRMSNQQNLIATSMEKLANSRTLDMGSTRGVQGFFAPTEVSLGHPCTQWKSKPGHHVT